MCLCADADFYAVMKPTVDLQGIVGECGVDVYLISFRPLPFVLLFVLVSVVNFVVYLGKAKNCGLFLTQRVA